MTSGLLHGGMDYLACQEGDLPSVSLKPADVFQRDVGEEAGIWTALWHPYILLTAPPSPVGGACLRLCTAGQQGSHASLGH